MHYCINSLLKNNNEIMQYCIINNDIALLMHYRALLQMPDQDICFPNSQKLDLFEFLASPSSGLLLSARKDLDTINIKQLNLLGMSAIYFRPVRLPAYLFNFIRVFLTFLR